MEKALTSFILGVTVLFGGFMIFLILTVQVVEKNRDIGVLQSMGVTPWGAAGVFFRIGMTLCMRMPFESSSRWLATSRRVFTNSTRRAFS